MAVGTPVDEFELMRRRVKQEGQAAGQQRQQQLKRQFARSGQLSSGAFIKQSGIEAEQQQQAQQRAVEGVDIAEAGVKRQERESALGRTFAREERIGGQEFVAKQQESQNTFAALQAQIGREFTTGEREAAQVFSQLTLDDQQEFQAGLAKEGRDLQEMLATDALDLQTKIFDFESKITEKNNAINMMNSLFGIGFDRPDVQNIMEQLGLGDILFTIPGSEPVEAAPTVAPKTSSFRRDIGKVNPFNPESIFSI